MRIFLLVILFFVSSCIDEIDLTPEESQSVLVVDGEVSLDNGSVIRLTRSEPLGKSVFSPISNAQIFLLDDQGLRIPYDYNDDGTYLISSELIQAKPGNVYQMEILLADGSTYRSLPEKIPFSQSIDSLSYQISFEEFLSDVDVVQTKKFFNLTLLSTVPDITDNLYYRWSIENVYAFFEITCGPFHSPKTCYILDPIAQNSIHLARGFDFKSGSPISQVVFKKGLDSSFGSKQSFRVFQHIISKNEFEYWDKIDQLANNVGSILDAPPAAVRGNVFNVHNQEEMVLGYFSVIAKEDIILFLTRSDLPDDDAQLPPCGVPGFYKFPLPGACCNCLSLRNSSLERPDYWD